MLYITLAITGIVFFITQILFSGLHSNTRNQIKEKPIIILIIISWKLIWTVIPAIASNRIGGFGIDYWFKITGDAPKDAMQVEVTGNQFEWEFRYPGRDGVLGKKYYKAIDPAKNNPLGQLWDDPYNHDDVMYNGICIW